MCTELSEKMIIIWVKDEYQTKEKIYKYYQYLWFILSFNIAVSVFILKKVSVVKNITVNSNIVWSSKKYVKYINIITIMYTTTLKNNNLLKMGHWTFGV